MCVIGGANSAGQAALHLAPFATRVMLLVRGESLAASVSDYLITQLKATPSIGVRLRTRTADGHGQGRLEALTLEDVRTGQREQVPAAAVVVMIGAEPRTQWRRDLVKLNNRGFVLTGRDVPPGRMAAARPPLPFKTSLLGDQDAGRPDPGNLRAASRVGQSDRLQLGPPGAQAVRVYASSRCAGDQVRSRFRNLRGSATGLSPG